MKFHSERLSGSGMFTTFYDALPGSQSVKEHDTAQFLGITVQTLRRYLSGKAQPPAPLVSLLWHESTYGRAVLDEHAHRGMLYARGESQALKDEAKRLRARVSELETEIDMIRTAYADNRPRLVASNARFFQVA